MKLIRLHFAGLVFFAALAALTIAPANAQTIVYDNGVNTANANSGIVSEVNFPQFIADTFTLGAASTFNQVQFLGFYGSGITPTADSDNFTITFYNTVAGVPDAVPFAGGTFAINNTLRTPADVNVPGIEFYSYVANLSSAVTLDGGTYGISIVNDTFTEGVNDFWLWGQIGTGTLYFRLDQANAWSSFPGDTAFTLVNAASAAPEPVSLALLLPFAIGVIARRKKSKNI